MEITKEQLSKSIYDVVAELCYEKYATLPKSGKPNELREWTLLAGVVMVRGDPNVESDLSELSEVVALGTGTKCLGQQKMSPQGNLLNDSHAEIMARRGFIRYLYQQVLITFQNGTSEVFERFESGKCIVRSDVTFHFFTSHTPCGDASIIPMTFPNCEDIGNCLSASSSNSEDIESEKCVTSSRNHNINSSVNDEGEWNRGSKRKLGDTIKTIEAKQPRINDFKVADNSKSEIPAQNALLEKNKSAFANDVHRTGAKCLTSELLQDPHLPGEAYHVEGALRTKPGRGDPTLSLSCSDKLCRWNVVGVQGALLALLLDKPIYFSSVTIGGGCPFSEIVLKRAVVDRLTSKLEKPSAECEFTMPVHYAVHNPKFMQASKTFVHARTPDKQPCPSSIAWCNVLERSLEVAVEGRKQGVTKKALCTPKGRLAICKKELLKTFVEVLEAMPNIGIHILSIIPSVAEKERKPSQHLVDLTYRDIKNLSKTYQQTWNSIKEKCFPAWKSKPDSYLMFKLVD